MKFNAEAAGVIAALVFPSYSIACDSCYGPANVAEHVRHVKRIQPGAPEAVYGPTRPLEWGQLNFMHTTDTHGWLAGHLKEQNYGADWGDFVTFSKHFQHEAGNMGVDLLLIDTGDLHDGTGLSDATSPDGAVSNSIFQEVEYDLLTIGNHELYLADVAYQTFTEISKFWGDKYLTSNVQILNNVTNQWEYIGKTYRYFTTPKGIRIMAFGVLYDFTGNTNLTKVIKAKDMITQPWFQAAVNFSQPIDLFLLIGHNIPRPTTGGSTLGLVKDAIRKVRPNTPIQIFGGHSHIRDFIALDASSTALESGRYCETLGWVSMSGFSKNNSGYTGVVNPHGVPNPTRKATKNSTTPFVYSRRYLDWNRYTFEYHSIGKQSNTEFDYHSGLRVTDEVTAARKKLNLGQVYGCVPDFYCMTCVPFNDPKSIFTVLSDALATSVTSPNRTDKARIVISNTGGIRFDLYKGPFTFDDNFIVSPFRDVWRYFPDVPYAVASTVVAKLNAGPASKRSDDLGVIPALMPRDLGPGACPDPVPGTAFDLSRRDAQPDSPAQRIRSRQAVVETPGYTTTDDFGIDGDDTAHSKIPFYSIPNYFAGQAGFPTTGPPATVDIVFVDFIEPNVQTIIGGGFTSGCYASCNFTSQDYLIPYAQAKWQTGVPNCSI